MLVLSLVLPTHAAVIEPQCGKASWYAMTSMTASGERANPNTMTAAHRTLPFGTKVRVTNRRNGRSVVLRINDRGPFIKGRIIDVTKIAAQKLGFVDQGWTHVGISSVDQRFNKQGCTTRGAIALPTGTDIPRPTQRPS